MTQAAKVASTWCSLGAFLSGIRDHSLLGTDGASRLPAKRETEKVFLELESPLTAVSARC
ncbi:hypothetical protein RMSM_02339 [Rhodopirellula maiorica SM1]|uniref:Uncharacterized protein n=1 Tax=Rhodopirellula maiorica SM1 TaxID=1265738 RepID=M5RNE0_9BACT|nr:hypothetical protein RMSM_02339 [Rhodopirellula maiorica SM1]